MDAAGNPIRILSPCLDVGHMSECGKFVLVDGQWRAATYKAEILRPDSLRPPLGPRESAGPTLFSDRVTTP